MKTTIRCAAVFPTLASATTSEANVCLKCAVVEGTAGHFAGHYGNLRAAGVAHSTLTRQHDPDHRSLPVTAGLPIVPINVIQENLMLRTLTVCAFALSTICAANAGQTGMASHYRTRDKNQNGSKTASGRPLRDHELTGAHRSLPFGSKVRVTGSNGRSVVVTITDRGPFVRNRIIDLSMGAARKLGFHGLARVRLSKI